MGTVGNKLWNNKGWILVVILLATIIITNPGWLSHIFSNLRYLMISLVIFGIAGYKIFGKILDS